MTLITVVVEEFMASLPAKFPGGCFTAAEAEIAQPVLEELRKDGRLAYDERNDTWWWR